MTTPTLLVIEYDAAVHVLLVELLQHAGYEVYTALHGDDLQDIVQQVNPSLAIISGGKRGTFAAGWRTAQTLKRAHAALPLLMLSTNAAAVAEGGRTTRGQLFVAGLQKPFAVDDLFLVVARWSQQEQLEGNAESSMLGEDEAA